MKEQTFVAREFEIFGGLDVDKKSIAVTFMSHQGTLQSFSMPHRAEHLLSYVGKHFEGKKIAFARFADNQWNIYTVDRWRASLCGGGPLDDSQSAGAKSKDQPARQSETLRASQRRTIEERSRADRILPPTAPARSAERYLCARHRGDEASDQSDAAV